MEEDKKTPKQYAEEINKAIEGMEDKFKGMIGEDAFKEVQDKLVELEKSGASIEKLQNEVVKLTDELKETNLKMQGPKGGKDTSIKGQINNWIKDNAEAIKELYAKGSGTIQLETKAVGDISTANATLPSPAPALVGVQTAPPTNVNLRGVFWQSLVNNVTPNGASHAYTETVAGEGDYAIVAEAGSKPKIDLDITTRYVQPYKIAAHEVLSEESVQDIPGLQNIANNYLKAQHDLKVQNKIFFGPGTGNEPTGATVYGRSFVAGDMANAFAAPNIMHVINAAVTDIYTTHNYVNEMPYMANTVLMNPIDFFVQFVGATTTEGTPLYPNASLFNEVRIGGMLVKPHEEIPADKILVADMGKFNVSNYMPYRVQIGWINDQLIKNQFTMVGESRIHAFVRNLDEQAFIYDDISVIKAAITTA